MAQVVYAAAARADLDRLCDFLGAQDPTAAARALELIDESLSILQRHPMIGRPVELGMRELVVSQRESGYLALYQYYPEDDVALVLALRHQKEAGYPQEP